ncbi:MAG TPA: hypothetical protein VLV78_06535 [Thermoanaerobaculia bacterium]|nr:hypothetical protein [Thermoanaerobaculia bacterium]
METRRDEQRTCSVSFCGECAEILENGISTIQSRQIIEDDGANRQSRTKHVAEES